MSGLWWIFVLIALVAGVIAGWCAKTIQVRRQYLSTSTGPKGNCVNQDTVVVAQGVTQNDCRATCRTCTWVQANQ
jgi:hypothetical protein